MIHVQYAHSTWTAVMGSRRFRLRTIVTESVILKVTFSHNWVATPLYDRWCSRRVKGRKTKHWKSNHRQDHSYAWVENSTEIADGENNRVHSPDTTTWTFRKLEQTEIRNAWFKTAVSEFCGKILTSTSANIVNLLFFFFRKIEIL